MRTWRRACRVCRQEPTWTPNPNATASIFKKHTFYSHCDPKFPPRALKTPNRSSAWNEKKGLKGQIRRTRRRRKETIAVRLRLLDSLMTSPKVKAKPNTNGQFLRPSDNATCVKGLPTTGSTIFTTNIFSVKPNSNEIATREACKQQQEQRTEGRDSRQREKFAKPSDMAEAETRTAEDPRIRVSVLTSGEEVIEYWRKNSLKIHLNQN